jgi:hypothetical protein
MGFVVGRGTQAAPFTSVRRGVALLSFDYNALAFSLVHKSGTQKVCLTWQYKQSRETRWVILLSCLDILGANFSFDGLRI